MLGDTKLYGKAYKIIADSVEKYYDKAYANAFYIDSMKAELKNSGNAAWKENHDFPVKHFSLMANLMIHWFDNEFYESGGVEQLIKDIKNVWAFHRKYLLVDELTEEITEKLLDDVPSYTSSKPYPIVRMCTKAMEDLYELNEKIKGAESGNKDTGSGQKGDIANGKEVATT